MSFYHKKESGDCEGDYKTMDNDGECNKVKEYLDLDSSYECSDICKVDLYGMIEGLENTVYKENINQLIRKINDLMNYKNPIEAEAKRLADLAETAKKEADTAAAEAADSSKTAAEKEKADADAEEKAEDAADAAADAEAAEKAAADAEAKNKKELVYKYQRLYDLIFELKTKERDL